MEALKEDNDKTKNTNFDKLLSKYSIIWIWSIILGLNSGLLYSFYNFRVSNLGIMTILLACVYCIAFLFSFGTLVLLYRILHEEIIPNILIKSSRSKGDIGLDRDDKSARIKFLISRSFYFMIIALLFKFSAFIIEVVMNGLTKY